MRVEKNKKCWELLRHFPSNTSSGDDIHGLTFLTQLPIDPPSIINAKSEGREVSGITHMGRVRRMTAWK